MSDRGTFRPLGECPEPVVTLDRAQARSGYRIFRGETGFEVAIPEHLLERAMFLGRRAAPNEWIGLLVGQLFEDARGRHLVVIAILLDAEARASRGHVETTPASEFAVRELARRLFPDTIACGWIHSHVGVGARFSGTDLKTQRTWTSEYAIGIVVDPFHARLPLGVYRGPDAELLTSAPREKAPPREESVPRLDAPRAPGRPRPRPWSRMLAALVFGALACLSLLIVRRREEASTRLATIERRQGLLGRRLQVLEAQCRERVTVPAAAPPSRMTDIDDQPHVAPALDARRASPGAPAPSPRRRPR